MLILDCAADLSLDAARGRLSPPARPQAVGPALLAAALMAAAAVGLAGAVILGPPGASASTSAAP